MGEMQLEKVGVDELAAEKLRTDVVDVLAKIELVITKDDFIEVRARMPLSNVRKVCAVVGGVAGAIWAFWELVAR